VTKQRRFDRSISLRSGHCATATVYRVETKQFNVPSTQGQPRQRVRQQQQLFTDCEFGIFGFFLFYPHPSYESSVCQPSDNLPPTTPNNSDHLSAIEMKSGRLVGAMRRVTLNRPCSAATLFSWGQRPCDANRYARYSVHWIPGYCPSTRCSSNLTQSTDQEAQIPEKANESATDLGNETGSNQHVVKSTALRKPRASNPTSFQKNFFEENREAARKKNSSKNQFLDRGWSPRLFGERKQPSQSIPPFFRRRSRPRTLPQPSVLDSLLHGSPMPSLPNGLSRTESSITTLGHHLKAQGETVMPASTWVQIEGISPISSLEAMLSSIRSVLDAEQALGMIDLDAPWSDGQPVPFLSFPAAQAMDDNDAQHADQTNEDKWVRQAMIILSPFGRPTGWYLRLDNRSVVYALLKHAEENPLQCTWKTVKVQEYQSPNGHVSQEPLTHGNCIVHRRLSDHTLRVENCPTSVSNISLMNFFSRYDLQFGEDAIERWQGVTNDGKKCPPTTCLVHFADASWARAALREKQATFISKFGRRVVTDDSNPHPLRLIQYPRQIL
jgi:hypothetical protein